MDTAKIAGNIAGRIMSIIHCTSLYKDTASIKGINFDEVADSVRVKAKGSRVEVELEITDVVFRLALRKNYLMLDNKVWDTEKMQDIRNMLRYLQERVTHDHILIAAAGSLI